jgi:hypothetical protein
MELQYCSEEFENENGKEEFDCDVEFDDGFDSCRLS